MATAYYPPRTVGIFVPARIRTENSNFGDFGFFGPLFCRGVYYHDSVLSGNLYPHLLGASRYFREKFELVFLKIVNCDFD